tara:strand:- start:618 stop:878 length:261 start_codon:yes stop_codon:yes gene_type:complete
MAVKTSLVGLSLTGLVALRDALEAGIIAGVVRGTSYTIAGRSFSFPTLESMVSTIHEANYAIGLLSGTTSMNVRANFNPAIGRGSR